MSNCIVTQQRGGILFPLVPVLLSMLRLLRSSFYTLFIYARARAREATSPRVLSFGKAKKKAIFPLLFAHLFVPLHQISK